MDNQNDHDIYVIPPNFVDTGTFFGGMFKARNVVEAGVLAAGIGIPIFLFLPSGLTVRIIVLCLTALPLALAALIGISGESLSSFLLIFLKYMKNRRIVGEEGHGKGSKQPGRENMQEEKRKPSGKTSHNRKSGMNRASARKYAKEEDFPAEFDQIKGYEIRRKLRMGQNQEKPGERARKSDNKRGNAISGKSARVLHRQASFINPAAEYLPISRVENGIIYTKDHRYVKVVEVVPINFMLRSAREQRSIIYSFVSYLKISPVKLQFKVLTRRADIGRHMDTVRKEMAQEDNEQCRLMQEDYLQFVRQISSREAVTRRFFLIFEYEPWDSRRGDDEDEAVSSLQGAVHTASNYLRQCGNEVVAPDNEDEFTADVLYNLLCRNESAVKPLSRKVQETAAQHPADEGGGGESGIPAVEFIAPRSIDFTHAHYICIDGLYYAYRLVPSDGYRTQVPAGWLSLMVNAGDGIDLDMFLSR